MPNPLFQKFLEINYLIEAMFIGCWYVGYKNCHRQYKEDLLYICKYCQKGTMNARTLDQGHIINELQKVFTG